MPLYVLRSDGAYVSYDGMTRQQIIETLGQMGLTAEFIEEAAYTSATEQADK